MAQTTEIQYDVITIRTYIFGAILLFLGVFGIYMMAARAHTFPLLTVFFYSISSNAAMALFPHEPVIIWYGKTLNLWSLSTSATLGTLLAAYLDYHFFTPLLNLSFTGRYRSKSGYKRVEKLFNRAPFTAIVVGGFLPLPFYPLKFLALSSKYPLARYMSAVAVGRFPRYFLLGLAGMAFQIPNWIIIGSFILILVILNYRKVWNVVSWPFAATHKYLFNRNRT